MMVETKTYDVSSSLRYDDFVCTNDAAYNNHGVEYQVEYYTSVGMLYIFQVDLVFVVIGADQI